MLDLARWNVDRLGARTRQELGELLEGALARIDARVLGAEKAVPLTVRRARSRLADLPIIVVKLDSIERLVPTLIAGRRVGQFSFTPQGEVFATMHAGWHKDQDRVNVTGVSAQLETLEPRVYVHRGGKGGRVSVGRDIVRCANCPGALLALDAVPVLELEAKPGECAAWG